MTADPTREQMLLAIKTQTCPWCSDGPFLSLAAHTAAAHGIHADRLRHIAGLKRLASIASETLSTETAEKRRTTSNLGDRAEAGRLSARRTHVLEALAAIAVRSTGTGITDVAAIKSLAALLHTGDPIFAEDFSPLLERAGLRREELP